MLLNLCMAAWTYSIYLTIRERATVFYLIILCGGIIEAFTSLFFSGKMGNLQILGKMVNMVIYGVISYIVTKNYVLHKRSQKEEREDTLSESMLS